MMQESELSDEQEMLAEAIADAPEQWVEPDEKTLHVQEVGNHTADEMLKLVEESLEMDVVTKLIRKVDDDVTEALLNFVQNREQWTVERAESEKLNYDEAWQEVREVYSEESKNEARYAAVQQLREEFNFATIEDGQTLYWYDNEKGIYRGQTEQRIRERLDQTLQGHYSRSEVSQIIHRLESGSYVERDEFQQPASKVCVQNGVLDLESGTLSNHRPDHYFLWQLPVEYDENADCPEFKEFLDDVCPDEYQPMLQEYVGYALQPGMKRDKAMVVFGPTDAGKSVFLNVVEALFGFDNTTNFSIQQLTNEKWSVAELVGTPVNVDNDLSTQSINNLGRFKKMVSGEGVKAERKYKDPFTVKPRTKHFFSANRAPERREDDEAFWNRWLTVIFPESVPRDEQNPDLTQKLTTDKELSGILNWAIEGYQRLEDQQFFTNEPTADENRELWERYGSAVERFYGTCLKEASDAFVPKSEAYTAYKQFAEQKGLEVVSKHKFTSALTKHQGVSTTQRRMDGEKIRLYTGVELSDDAPVPNEKESENRETVSTPG